MISYKLKTTLFIQSVFIFCEFSYLNLKRGLKESKKFAKEWLTMYNVCSVHHGMFITSRGVKYIGGYHGLIGGCSVHQRNIMMHEGDIMSTSGDTMSTSGGYDNASGGAS